MWEQRVFHCLVVIDSFFIQIIFMLCSLLADGSSAGVLVVYSLEGICTAVLLIICTCAYIRRVPRLKEYFLADKKGVFGTFYKGSREFFKTAVEPHDIGVDEMS